MNELEITIPESLETMKLPCPELLSYYEDLEDRIIWIDYEINESVLEVTKKILRWNKIDVGKPVEERTPIKLLIFSPGGDLYSALSLINIIQISKTPVWTYSMGETSSAGLYLLIAGKRRFALRDTTAVLHKGSAIMLGTSQQIDASANWYKQQLNRLKEYVLEQTSFDPRLYKKCQNEDYYLTIEELVKYKFVDEIIDNIETIIGGEGK